MFADKYTRQEPKKRFAAPQAKTKALPDYIQHASNSISHAHILSFAKMSQWIRGEDGYERCLSLQLDRGRLDITVGLPSGDKSELWDYLRAGGAKMVKTYFALWARWFDEGGQPGQPITVSINQFCHDLGFAKHKNGGYRPEVKRQATQMLEAIMSLEMVALYRPPSTKEKQRRIRGPVWSRLIAEEADQTTDRNAETKWETASFCYTPGPWFADPVYSRFQEAIGKIGSGLLAIESTEEWAILIGGYLATLTRTNKYKPLHLRVETILVRANRAQTKDAKRRATETQNYFERAMDVLQKNGVIKNWSYDGRGAEELDDEATPAKIEDYYASSEKASDWRKKTVNILLPDNLADQTARLIEQQKKQITKRRTLPG